LLGKFCLLVKENQLIIPLAQDVFIKDYTLNDDNFLIIINSLSLYPQSKKDESLLNFIGLKIIETYKKNGQIMKSCPENTTALLYDKNKKIILVGRDKLGLLPIYWSSNQKKIAISTSSRYLIEEGFVSKKINYQSVDDFLTLQFIPDSETMWRDIKKLQPGTELNCKLGMTPKTTQYWDVEFNNNYMPESERVGKLEELIHNAFRQQNIEEKELALISGGIDTGTNISFLKFHGHKPDGLTITFKETVFDESYHAKITANRFNIEHHLINYNKLDLYLLNDMLKQYDEPIGDQAALAAYKGLSKLSGYKAVYSGEGADGFFSLPRKFKNDFNNVNSTEELARKYVDSIKYLDPILRVHLYKKRIKSIINTRNTELIYQNLFNRVNSESIISVLMYGQLKTWTVDNVVYKDRQNANSFGLMAKFPIINTELLAFMTSIPIENQIDFLSNKRLLRIVASKYLPKEIMEKPKQPFSIPIKNWFDDPIILNSCFERIFEDDHPIYNIFEKDKLQELVKIHSDRKENLSLQIWQILSLATWLDVSPVEY
jgi:asparagine synthase (glutamine-hydrolysing)